MLRAKLLAIILLEAKTSIIIYLKKILSFFNFRLIY